MHARFGLFALATLVAVAGCSADEAEVLSGKGSESALPGKDDSFRKPTEHGSLNFGLGVEGKLTEDESFHVWDFTLTDDARVTLQTTPQTANLDTVMYVYQRSDSETNWGAYDQRNDDWDGNIWSRIELDGTKGHYRVLIKGYKTSLRGTFTLLGECDGAGCPSAGGSELNIMPELGGLTQGCFMRLQGAANAMVVSNDGFSVHYEKERAVLDGLAQKAVDYYAEYWQDIGYWGDMDWDGEGHDLNVELYQGFDGSLVSVDAGGDEDTLRFLFDAREELVAYYHSEQSPVFETFCAEDETAKMDAPEEFCFGAYLAYMPHNEDDTRELTGTATVAEVANLDGEVTQEPMLRMAVDHYANNVLLGETDAVSWSGERWESADWGYGARVTLSAGGKPALTYDLGGSEYDAVWVFTATDANQTARFLCEQDSF